MNGNVWLIFTIDGNDIKFNVGDVEWLQERTSNMDPPKPIKDEIKQIWNNPNQGFGLLGLGLKKLAGGLQNTILGPVGSSKVQNEDLICDFSEEYSMQNSKGITPESKKKEKSDNSGSIKDGLEKILEKKLGNSSKIDVNIVIKEKVYYLEISYVGEEIMKISFELK